MPATTGDKPFLLELEETCMRAYAEALWDAWKPSASIETLDVAGHEIIMIGGENAGCIAVSWQPEHLFINKLYISPIFQGRGIGASVLRAKTQVAAEAGLPTHLSVLTTNPAVRFYQREGFTIASETAERRRMVKALA
jgi:GNAT superfamily N-acetyltransferase